MTQPRHILVVDHDPGDRALTALVVGQSVPDAVVIAADDPLSVGEILVRQSLAGVVVERQLPWCDVLSLIGKIREAHPDSVVITYGREPVTSLLPEWTDLGVTAYLSKSSADLLLLGDILADRLGTAAAEPPALDTSKADQQPAAKADPPPVEQGDEQDARFMSEMFYAISHDLMQPLQIFVRQTRLLDDMYKTQLDDAGQNLVTNIGQVAGHMQVLLDSILSYYRLDASDNTDDLVDIGEALDIVLATLESTLDTVSAKVSVGKLPALKISRGKGVQLFQNLIGNAIKFRSDKPLTIAIDALEVKDNWLFTVKDNGIGIDENSLDQIFDMFKRLHPQSQYPGNGIGLALCARIVAQHGGKLWATSKPGEGAAFHFTLPRQPVDSEKIKGRSKRSGNESKAENPASGGQPR